MNRYCWNGHEILAGRTTCQACGEQRSHPDALAPGQVPTGWQQPDVQPVAADAEAAASYLRSRRTSGGVFLVVGAILLVLSFGSGGLLALLGIGLLIVGGWQCLCAGIGYSVAAGVTAARASESSGSGQPE